MKKLLLLPVSILYGLFNENYLIDNNSRTYLMKNSVTYLYTLIAAWPSAISLK